ncbi:LPS export ABC transporter permease LptF [Candidatus Methylocalor cossyra]|uniref:Lipopolysaccharide export system permease protein LptF n=1 Tax=Candidatus Methylocalor cossyra TaxID=3108543 RepID=A0ABM9NJZ6_9GAMM
MFAVVDRMVSFEFAKTLTAILSVLVVIIVSRKFLDILRKAIEGDVAANTLFHLLGLKTLGAIAILIPASTFMAILSVIGRMYRDQEMAILASGGMGMRRLYQALSWALVPVILLAAYMALEVLPWTEREAQLLMKKDEQSADIRAIKPGRFNEFSAGDTVLYAEGMTSDNRMTNVFVQRRLPNSSETTVADHGRLERNPQGEYFVILNDGRRYQGLPGRVDYIITEFQEHAVRVSSPEEEAAALKRDAESTLQLIRSGTPKELAELQKRLAVPLGALFLALLAVPLARVAPRRGPFGNVLTAFLIYVIYENLQKISQALLMTEKIPLWLSYSGTYLMLLALTLGLFLKQRGSRWIAHGVKELLRR